MSALASTWASGQGLQASWEGIRTQDYTPLNVHGAPGPVGVLATVDEKIQYFTKTGATVWGPFSLADFWPSASARDRDEPKVVFDHDSRRFFVTNGENHDSRFWLNVAVSRSSDPRTSGTGDWIFYRFEATEYTASNRAGGINLGGASPGLAIDGQALYVSFRQWPFTADGALLIYYSAPGPSVLLVMGKRALLDGTGTLSPPLNLGNKDWPVTFGHWEPVTAPGDSPGNIVYLVDSLAFPQFLRVGAVSDPLGARTLHLTDEIDVTDFGTGTSAPAPQLGSGKGIALDEPGDNTRPVLNNASFFGGDIWVCAGRGDTDGPKTVAYYRLRLNGWPFGGVVSQVEAGLIGQEGYWNFCPALGMNKVGDVCLAWTRSSANSSPTMMFAQRNAGDRTFGAPQLVKASDQPFTTGLWGSYATVWPDPADGSFWIGHEWSSRATGAASSWWGRVGVPGTELYVAHGLTPNELGTQALPFHTVAKALKASIHGGLHVSSGHYNERLTISQATAFVTFNGPVVLGAP